MPPQPISPWQDGAKTNGTSVFAIASSLSGFICFLGVGGALGIVLGLIARAEISRAEGRESGRGLATAAIALGAFNVCATVIAVAVGITYLARPATAGTSSWSSAPTTAGPVRSAPSVAPRATKPSARTAPPARASRETGTQVTTIGDITVADLAGDFELELRNQRALASTAGETLVLWLVEPNCKPCNGVAAALTRKEAQKSLAKLRFVRVDSNDFQPELEQLGIPTEKIPGFALLDARGHVRDFIHGGEWDADIASNIAPVLGKFAHGGYVKRRDPWRGPRRGDETPL